MQATQARKAGMPPDGLALSPRAPTAYATGLQECCISRFEPGAGKSAWIELAPVAIHLFRSGSLGAEQLASRYLRQRHGRSKTKKNCLLVFSDIV